MISLKPTNDEEHAIWFPRILNFGQKLRCESERKCDFCGLIEVCLQDGFVEDEETLQHL